MRRNRDIVSAPMLNIKAYAVNVPGIVFKVILDDDSFKRFFSFIDNAEYPRLFVTWHDPIFVKIVNKNFAIPCFREVFYARVKDFGPRWPDAWTLYLTPLYFSRKDYCAELILERIGEEGFLSAKL